MEGGGRRGVHFINWKYEIEFILRHATQEIRSDVRPFLKLILYEAGWREGHGGGVNERQRDLNIYIIHM